MAGLLKASNIIQPAYVSPHRKRKTLRPCRVHNIDYKLDTLGFKCVDKNTKRRRLRMTTRCIVCTEHFRPLSFASRLDWHTSSKFENSFRQLSSTSKALPTGSLGIPSAPVFSTESMESIVPDMTHTLLNFLLEAYSFIHEDILVATVILAAIIVVATFVARSGHESHVKGMEKSLVFVSRPSQFNRFIYMRCPSMSMNLSAKPQASERAGIEYQRMCLHATDGGVVAIDWPAELDFVAEEDHLANTLLLVPGTTEGSNDDGLKQFAIEAMRYGYFPVILNPRGCAGSPLTTPRVFSGADSDDVRLAVQHIVRERPGSSLMGVGWGLGANMLTKYLGEDAGSTSLMAAVAISNPFDLQQSSMFLGMKDSGQVDRVMARGLVKILKENKVLFAGQSKGFDLKVALASTSTRDFDASVSKATHDFGTLDEFYSAASSARFISSVQVPLLFVQGEDFSMPVTSVPYSILEENPYTAALVALTPAKDKFSASGVVREPGSASGHRWSHTVAFEWLAAVEVALLKGQHPLLNPVSSYDKVSIESKVSGQPSLPIGVSIEGNGISRSHKGSKMDVPAEALDSENLSADGGDDGSMQVERMAVVAATDHMGENEKVDESGIADTANGMDSNLEAETIPSLTKVTPQETESFSSKAESAPEEAENVYAMTESTPQEVESPPSEAESNPSEAKSIPSEEKSASPEPSPPPEEGLEESAETIQMRAAAESVMNVLDITMPGTLSDEKKTQVLTAVGEGETILTALQEAVPEDVRGNMATAVSGAVQARGLSFNLVGFGKGMPPPKLPSGLIESIKGKIAGGKKETIPTTPHIPGDGPTSDGTRDTNTTKSASSGKVDDEGPADPAEHNHESKKADHQGTEKSTVKQEDDGQSVGENQSKEESSKGSKEPKSEESKESSESKTSGGKQDSNAKEPKGSSPSNSEERKLEESKAEGLKGSAESKSMEGKHEDQKSEESKANAEGKPLGGKQEERKTDESKESSESKRTRGTLEEPKSDESKGSSDGKPVGGKHDELKSDESKESSDGKPVGGKHDELKSDESKESSDGKPVGGKHDELKSDESKESSDGKSVGGKPDELKSDESKGSSDGKPVGGKHESVDKGEGAGQAEGKKDGAQEAPVSEVSRADDKRPENTGDNNGGTNAKEETKPAEENQSTPDTPVPAPVAASPPPSPVPESSSSPALPTPNTGMEPPLDVQSAFEALAGFDDSTQMAVTNVFGVVEGMLERLEQEQAAVPDSANGKDGSNGQENSNGKVADRKFDDKSAMNDLPPENNAENGATQTEVARNGLNIADRGGHLNTRETDKTNEREVVEVTGKKQEDGKKGTTKATTVPEESKPVKETSVNIPPSNQGSRMRPQSKVMMIQRVGSCTLVEPMLEDSRLKTHFYRTGSGAFSKSSGAVVKREGTEIQQSRLSVKEANSMKPVVSKMTIEQLSQEVDQEIENDGDDSSAKINEMRDDKTIEAEVTEIKETETSSMIENIVKDALKLEVLRRLGAAGMESLGIDLEQEVAKVAVSVAETVQRWKKDPGAAGSSAGKLGILSSNPVVTTLGNVMGGTHILGGLVPVGVLAGVILASLGAFYLIVTDNQQSDGENEKAADEEGGMARVGENEDEIVSDSDGDRSPWQNVKASALDVPVLSVNTQSETPLGASSELGEDPWLEPADVAEDDIADEYGYNSESEGSSDDEEDEREGNNQGGNQSKIMGMMAAAAVTGGATFAGMNTASKENADEGQGRQTTGQELAKGGNVISSFHPLAEKALSVAAPVVPTNEDGEIDHERLVAMLAELGQRGGFLRLIGKVALLWGGLRGAMSLTDRLLVFVQMNKRPLHLRLVGFCAMVVLLWSPVLIPVLPSLLHQWATKAPSGVSDAASAVGLYGAILILVTIWGKRVRGYNKPLFHYGLRVWSKRKVQDLGLGFALGGALVSFLYTTNFILGYVQFSWGMLLATNPRLPGTVGVALFTLAKVCKLAGQALALGLAVAVVEEVLFRAWLQEEIAVDLGFHRAVFISAIAFALVHWSPAAMPGLWFMSVSLAGARAKMNRNLAFPIGVHSGLVAVNHLITAGGLVQFLPDAPTWFTGAHVSNPLAGALGTGIMALLAVTLYPRTTTHPLPVSKDVEHAL